MNSMSPPGSVSAWTPVRLSGNTHVSGAAGESSTIRSSTAPAPPAKLSVLSGSAPA